MAVLGVASQYGFAMRSEYDLEILIRERMRDRLEEAARERLFQEAVGPTNSQRRFHHVPFKYATAVIAAVCALISTVLPSSAAGGETLSNAYDATAVFRDPVAALAGGYALLTDAAGVACIDMPGQGAMGVHYVNSTLVQGGTLDAARPQALVYEVQANGDERLVALEYVVFQSAWDANHTAPPSLFGQTFMSNPADNRFGLPAFYSLHAWIWKDNPTGMFSPFNPQVRCESDLRNEPAETSPSDGSMTMDGMGAALTIAP